MGPRGGGGFGFLHMIAGLVGTVIFLAILLGLAALAYKIARKKGWVSPRHRSGHGGHHREPGAPPPGPPGPGEALRILDERLARGEIEIPDYLARRDALTGTSYPPFHQPPSPPKPDGPAPDGPAPGGPAPTREEPRPPSP